MYDRSHMGQSLKLGPRFTVPRTSEFTQLDVVHNTLMLYFPSFIESEAVTGRITNFVYLIGPVAVGLWRTVYAKLYARQLLWRATLPLAQSEGNDRLQPRIW